MYSYVIACPNLDSPITGTTGTAEDTVENALDMLNLLVLEGSGHFAHNLAAARYMEDNRPHTVEPFSLFFYETNPDWSCSLNLLDQFLVAPNTLEAASPKAED